VVEHRLGDVDRDDRTAVLRYREGEGAGPTAHVDERRARTESALAEGCDVRRGVVLLLGVVTGDVGLVEVFGSRVGELVGDVRVAPAELVAALRGASALAA
jgi:hypothetical protein